MKSEPQEPDPEQGIQPFSKCWIRIRISLMQIRNWARNSLRKKLSSLKKRNFLTYFIFVHNFCSLGSISRYAFGSGSSRQKINVDTCGSEIRKTG
jgi:ABC-type enterochelin transport system ATPase subunit